MLWDDRPYGCVCGLSSNGCRKTKKRNCGMEGKMLWLMAAGLPPLPPYKLIRKKGENACLNRKILIDSHKDWTIKSVVKL